jgi:hypothetical protein
MIGIGRLYTLAFENVSITVQQTLFYVKPAADKICIIEGVYLSNVGGAADAGDAQEELYDLGMFRLPATVTVGSGGTAPTPQPVATNDAAAGFTGRVNDTTKATTSGTAALMHPDGMNVRIPYVWLPPPEHRHLVANAQAWICNLNTTPADAILFNGTCLIREIP